MSSWIRAAGFRGYYKCLAHPSSLLSRDLCTVLMKRTSQLHLIFCNALNIKEFLEWQRQVAPNSKRCVNQLQTRITKHEESSALKIVNMCLSAFQSHPGRVNQAHFGSAFTAGWNKIRRAYQGELVSRPCVDGEQHAVNCHEKHRQVPNPSVVPHRLLEGHIN